MSTTDRLAPFEAFAPTDWYDGPMPHVRVYRPDQRWQVTVDMATGDARVFDGLELFQWVFLTWGPSGGLVPVSEMNNGRVDMLSYAVAALYDYGGMLNRDMDELGLSLPD